MLNTHTSLRLLKWTTVSLGALCLVIVGYAFMGYAPPSTLLEGRLLPKETMQENRWQVITEQEVLSGATIAPDINVLFKLPEGMEQITREVLLGMRGRTVRYWGYCLPNEYEPSVEFGDRLPGKVFLSEAEREYRTQQQIARLHDRFSPFKEYTESDLNEVLPDTYIRHELDLFESETTCYIMAEAPLPIGLDEDGDEANTQVENEYGTDQTNPDTDEDGVSDGREIFFLHTNPELRDTDGDGLIDGIEDANHNGRVGADETDPNKWDTDRDGLPDGYMKMGKCELIEKNSTACSEGRRSIMRGEDKNLNGMVDENESDPRKWSTAGDGISDWQKYELCIFNGGTDC
ncbi:MAG: hypothetical protein PHI23_01735 [Candidatus Peribacteraceae bacterium]|nr:hypothetical protein [Candidatus Peribacteraceae bacterium]